MKRVGILLGVLILLFALASCAEAGGPMTAKMLEGTWEFDGGWKIYFLDEFENIIEAHFNWPGNPNKRAYLHVSLKDNILTGDYDYNYLVNGDGVAELGLAITITITYTDKTLALEFAGEGVLDGLSLTGGKKDNG